MTEARRLGESGDEPFSFFIDGEAVIAYPGETIGAALLAGGRRSIRRTTRRQEVRGLYCVMGVCWECAVVADGRTVRACMAPATPGLRAQTLRGHDVTP